MSGDYLTFIVYWKLPINNAGHGPGQDTSASHNVLFAVVETTVKAKTSQILYIDINHDGLHSFFDSLTVAPFFSLLQTCWTLHFMVPILSSQVKQQ